MRCRGGVAVCLWLRLRSGALSFSRGTGAGSAGESTGVRTAPAAWAVSGPGLSQSRWPEVPARRSGPAAVRRGGPLGQAAAAARSSHRVPAGAARGPGPGRQAGRQAGPQQRRAGRRWSLGFVPELREPLRLEGGGGC